MPAFALENSRENRGWPKGQNTNLRQRLRAATADAHTKIDRSFGTLDLANAGEYRRFLEASASALLPLEAALKEVGVEQILPDWTARSRRDAILDDLAKLDGVVRPVHVAKLADLGATLGTLYVLDGSRLGAKVLLSIVERSPDPCVAGATAYLRHGVKERFWPSFLTRLEQLAAGLPSDASAVAGALAAFDVFERAAIALRDDRASPAVEAVTA